MSNNMPNGCDATSNCRSSISRNSCRCSNPCCPAERNFFVSAGHSLHFFETNDYSGKIPFDENLADVHSPVAHAPGDTEFLIREAGLYRITYQVIVFTPVLAPDDPLPVSFYADLVGSTSGVLDTIHFTINSRIPEQHTVLVNLVKDERVSLRMYDPAVPTPGPGEIPDIMADGPAILFERLKCQNPSSLHFGCGPLALTVKNEGC